MNSKILTPPQKVGSPAVHDRSASLRKLMRRFIHQEMRAIDGHRASLRERWQIIRRTPRPGEALRYQVDLLPSTVKRVIGDHRRRLVLYRELLRCRQTGSR